MATAGKWNRTASSAGKRSGSTGLRRQELGKLRLPLDRLERADGVGANGFHRVVARPARVDAQVDRPRAHEHPPGPDPLLDRFGNVPDEELLDAALAIARQMTRHSRTALRHAKESLNSIEFMDLKGGYEFEQRMTGRLVAHADAKEAVTAMREGRPPRFADAFRAP